MPFLDYPAVRKKCASKLANWPGLTRHLPDPCFIFGLTVGDDALRSIGLICHPSVTHRIDFAIVDALYSLTPARD